MSLAALTREQLRGLLRGFLGEYTAGAGSFWTDAVLNNFLNTAYRYYQAAVEMHDPGRFAVAATPINVVSGTAEYTLSADAFVVWAVWWTVATKDPVLVFRNPRFRASEAERDASPMFRDNLPDYVPMVRLRGRTLVLSPIPTTSFTGALSPEVVAFAPEMGTDAAVPVLHPILHSLIAMRAAVLALDEDGEVPENYTGLLDTLRANEAAVLGIMHNTVRPQLDKTHESQRLREKE